MTTISWKTAISDLFNVAADWNTNTVPGAADDAILGTLAGTAYKVSSNTAATVSSLQTAANATLAVSGSTFTATNGTGVGANAGTIALTDNGTFAVGGTFNNSGSVTLNSFNPAQFLVAAAASLTGGGAIKLLEGTYAASNRLAGATAATTLTNVDNTISGAGSLGGGQLTLVNQAAGVINGTEATHQLVLSTGAGSVSNAGLIEDTGAAGLLISGSTINNAATGVIAAVGAGAHVDLQSATITGGTLKTSGGGIIQAADRGSVLDGATAAVNNQGTVVIAGDGTTLSLKGAINNTGVFSLTSFNPAQLVMAANTTLTGGGAVTLNEGTYAGSNQVLGATGATVLTNVDNTISGAGQLGVGQLTLVNQAAGVINATEATHQLVLNTGKAAVINSGLIEATGAAGLSITGTTVDDSSGGVVLAANSVVGLQSATIIGGYLKTSGSGSIQTTDRGSVLDGTLTHPVYMLGNLRIAGSGTSLTINGKINLTQKIGKVVTNGVITLDSFNPAQLIAGTKNAVLAGSQVVMAEGTYAASNQIIGVLTPGVKPKLSALTNGSTIVGAGAIGADLKLTNAATGIINATGGTHALVIAAGNTKVAGSNLVKNSGLIESTNPTAAASVGGLTISNTTITNTGVKAIIQANGAATHVDLATATIVGGVLKTLNGGVIQTVDRGSVLDGSTLLNALPVPVNNQGAILIGGSGTSLSLKGAINNTGSITVTSFNPSQLIMGANTTLTGAGTIVLTDNSYALSSQVFGATAGTSLTNVDNVISGAGQLGNGQLTLVNKAGGVINATGGTHQLVLNTGAVAVANDGLIEATGAAGLLISGTTVANSATGVIKAAGANVDLATATISGGTLVSASGGVFSAVDTASVLDGTSATVNNQAAVTVAGNGTSLSLKGAINNSGSITVTSFNPSRLIIAANTTLIGGGAVVLSEGTYADSNQLTGASGATTLTNSDNQISGAGQLGAGTLTLVNAASGIINASGGVHGLTINTGAAAVTNAGLIEATGAAGLTISSALANSGTLLANGGNIYVGGAVTGAGIDSIKGGARIEFAGANANTIAFDVASTGVAKLDLAQTFTGTVTGFATGKTLDLANIAFVGSHLSYAPTAGGGTLSVTDGSVTAAIKLSGVYTQAKFGLANDGSGHVALTYNGTGTGPSPAVGQMAQAMAGLTDGSAAMSSAAAGGSSSGPAMLLATPHAA